VEQAEENVTIARGGHLPTLSAAGDYYLQRPGFLSNVNWDAQVILTIPIFQGGIVQSQVRQAASLRKQNELTLSKARRLAQQQLTSYYSIYEADLLQIQKQQLATELAKKNYQVELRDYRFGLVTNIEVLQVLTTWQEGQRLLDKNLFQAKIDYLTLRAAAAFVSVTPQNKKGS
jgi:outer membrane protein